MTDEQLRIYALKLLAQTGGIPTPDELDDIIDMQASEPDVDPACICSEQDLPDAKP